MGVFGKKETGKRCVASILVSVFWLISMLGATLGAGYMVNRDANIAAANVDASTKGETRLTREADNPSTPSQRPLRIAALESLHFKIKGGFGADAGTQDGLLPPDLQFLRFQILAFAPERLGSGPVLDYNSSFSARAPPLTV